VTDDDSQPTRYTIRTANRRPVVVLGEKAYFALMRRLLDDGETVEITQEHYSTGLGRYVAGRSWKEEPR
jgi:hypothetical protein